MRIPALVITAFFLPLSSQAGTIVGNPNVGVVLDEGVDVFVGDLDAEVCGGNLVHTFAIDATLVLNQADTVVVNTESYCRLDIEVRWTPGGPLVWVPVSGPDTLQIVNGGAAVSIELGANSQTATLTP